MNAQIIPPDLTLMDLALVNWVLSRVKSEILTGRPSGQVIDQALKEVMGMATHDKSSSTTFPSSPRFE